MNRIYILAIVITAILILALTSTRKEMSKIVILDFESCISAGYPVLESYPRQCKVNGKTYVENIGNTLDKRNLIVLDNPQPNQKIGNPIEISGRARGNWYFEASFPAVIIDEDGRQLATFPVQAKGDWMTEGFVPFSGSFRYIRPTGVNGTLILKKDNPSGDPERDDELRIPIKFE